MVHARPLSAICGLLALCSVFTLRAKADNFTTTGTFTTDNQIVEIPLTTTTAQTYNFITTSYAAGGFDPVLTLFNGDGTLFSGMGNPVSNGGSDANLTDVLDPGSYTLTLTEFPSFSNDGTINGFTTDVPSLVASSCPSGPTGPFTDAVDCTQRNGSYAVSYTSSSVTPEPPSALLLFLPLAGVVYLNRRRLISASSL